jgi:Flp pilus assembly protein CpaB
VYVDTKLIPAGEKIVDAERQLIRLQCAKKTSPDDAIRKASDYADRPLIRRLLKGEVFARDHLKHRYPRCGVEGYRAMSFPIAVTQPLPGFLLPGNRVSVFCTFVRDEETITKRLLDNVEVLWVGPNDSPPAENMPASEMMLTAGVKVEDAEKISWAMREAAPLFPAAPVRGTR